jgi:hypothetical protein
LFHSGVRLKREDAVDAGRLTRRPTPPRRLPAAFFLNEHRRRVADIAVDRAEEANDGAAWLAVIE